MLIMIVQQELVRPLEVFVNKKKMNNKGNFVSMKIRRSQVASIYGVGSIYQFKDIKNRNSEYESLMLASIDEWFPNLRSSRSLDNK